MDDFEGTKIKGKVCVNYKLERSTKLGMRE